MKKKHKKKTAILFFNHSILFTVINEIVYGSLGPVGKSTQF